MPVTLCRCVHVNVLPGGTGHARESGVSTIVGKTCDEPRVVERGHCRERERTEVGNLDWELRSGLELLAVGSRGHFGHPRPWSALERRVEGFPLCLMPGDDPEPWDLDSAEENPSDRADLSGDEAPGEGDADATTQRGTPAPDQPPRRARYARRDTRNDSDDEDSDDESPARAHKAGNKRRSGRCSGWHSAWRNG